MNRGGSCGGELKWEERYTMEITLHYYIIDIVISGLFLLNNAINLKKCKYVHKIGPNECRRHEFCQQFYNLLTARLKITVILTVCDQKFEIWSKLRGRKYRKTDFLHLQKCSLSNERPSI